MAEAKRDNNQIVTLLAVSNADGTTPVVLWADPVTHRLLVSASSSAHSLLSASHDDSVAASVVLGDIIIGNATPKWARLAGNTTTTKKFLRQTGNGTISALPAWDILEAADIPDISATYALTGHNHDLAYSAIGHNHTGVYSPVGHDHAGVYAPVLGADDNYVTDAEKTNLHAPGSDNQDLSGYVLKSTYDAYSILYADTDNTPVALTVGTNTLVGRIAAGIVAIAIDSDLASVSANDDTIPSAKATKAALDLKAPIASPTFTGTVTIPAAILTGQIDLDIPASDHSAVGHVTNALQSGYTAAAFDLVFLGSGGKWLEVDADAVATCQGLLGITLEAKNDTEAMLVALPGSFVRDDTWAWTVGATLYAGETLGAIQEAIPTGADAIIKVIGFAISADVIFFNPSPDQQSTVA